MLVWTTVLLSLCHGRIIWKAEPQLRNASMRLPIGRLQGIFLVKDLICSRLTDKEGGVALGR